MHFQDLLPGDSSLGGGDDNSDSRTSTNDSDSANTQLALFVCTLVLPAYVAFLVERRQKYQRKTRTANYEIVVARVEREIYLFRTRAVPPYNIMESMDNVAGSKNSRQVFKERMQELLSTDAGNKNQHQLLLNLSENFWNDDDEAENGSSATAASEKQHHASPVQAESDDVELLNINYAELPRMPTETTPMLPKDNPKTRSGSDSVQNTAEDDHEKDDDGRSMLSPEEYAQDRLNKVLEQKTSLLGLATGVQSILHALMQILTLAASAAALFSLQWIVPIILAITAAIAGVEEVTHLNQRISVEKQVVDKLEVMQRSVKERDGAEENHVDEESQIPEMRSEQESKELLRLVEEAEGTILQGVIDLNA